MPIAQSVFATGRGSVWTPTLRWDAVAGATSYVVYYGTSSGSYGSSVDVGNVTSSPLPAGLTPGTTYYMVVRASNGAESGNSNEIAVRSGARIG